MKSVTLSLDQNIPRAPLEKAVTIGSWLDQQGLQFLVDYNWESARHNDKDILIVHFADHCEEMSTLFALAWVK